MFKTLKQELCLEVGLYVFLISNKLCVRKNTSIFKNAHNLNTNINTIKTKANV